MPVFVKHLNEWRDPFAIYRALRGARPSVLLESARKGPAGRYSVVARDPYLELRAKGRLVSLTDSAGTQYFSGNGFEWLEKSMRRNGFAAGDRRGRPYDDLPFIGGAIGFAGYEAKALVDPAISRHPKDDLNLPDICFFFFKEGVVFDHEKKRLYVFCWADRKGEADARFRRLVGATPAVAPTQFDKISEPLYLGSSLSREAFVDRVKKIKRHIRRGDVYQANLSQRLGFDLEGTDPLDVYARLRKINPSPFFGYFDAGDFQILSGSPERLVKLEDGVLETRPLAGTRPRAKGRKDEILTNELLLNEKERAEHLMLVDLERNDVGRVSEFGSVRADEFMTVENYSHVKHIVSNVRGTLRPDTSAVAAFRALFPGGTITGVPKIRCMQILDALEPVARGPYTGSLGYFDFSGKMDFNILIRSLVVKRHRAWLSVGAGIVADSDPQKEYDETLHKAEAVLSALGTSVARLSRPRFHV